jgi:WD40-like Beta Propeller Repeat
MTRNKYGNRARIVLVCSCALIWSTREILADNDQRCTTRTFGAFSDWSSPVNLGPTINSDSNEQHPAISADGLSLYITSDRPGGYGDFDLYVAHRTSVDDSWGVPQNLGAVVNSQAADTVPTFSADGHRMYFCSSRPGSISMQNGNIWVSYRDDASDDFGWQAPTLLGREINSERGECGPTLFEDPDTGRTTLYFNRCMGDACTSGDPTQKFDIYASVMNEDGSFTAAVPVTELNSGFRDTRSTIRNDGLEFFLTSSRPGGVGALDLWVFGRQNTADVWGVATNLGPTINTEFNEGAPALSCDGTTLYFYSNRPGGFGKTDLYVSTRTLLGDDQANAQSRRRSR